MPYSLCINNFKRNLGISLVSVTESPNPPPNAICHGKEEYDIDCDGDLRLWSIIAHTPYGKIPGYKFCCFPPLRYSSNLLVNPIGVNKLTNF